ncbi:MAG: SH3 domain-containing protein [Clostridia bacterium]|nr:SH3 domain-containing protein [Clostridia bacterium]
MKKFIKVLIVSAATVLMLLAVSIAAGAATMDSSAGRIATESGGLNVRRSANTSSEVISSLYKGSYVTLMWRSGDWWYVEFDDGKYGYCHSDYIDTVSASAKLVKTASGNLNVRSGAGTSYSRIGSLPSGEVVLVLWTSGDWSRVLYNGTKLGYVNSSYLTSSDTYSAVSISVPHYMQTDKRWASVTLGRSGKTIYRIGCTTTSIAMIESYRTGKAIYPDAMSRKLSYTSSGNVYWPSDYTAVTSTTKYLEKIYAELKAGKPVLFGAKTAAGGQHWVVITGYRGGASLSASGFTINDPADRTRKTLADLYADYPRFYKFFTYSG